jgi:hypothetical protein
MANCLCFIIDRLYNKVYRAYDEINCVYRRATCWHKAVTRNKYAVTVMWILPPSLRFGGRGRATHFLRSKTAAQDTGFNERSRQCTGHLHKVLCEGVSVHVGEEHQSWA